MNIKKIVNDMILFLNSKNNKISIRTKLVNFII